MARRRARRTDLTKAGGTMGHMSGSPNMSKFNLRIRRRRR